MLTTSNHLTFASCQKVERMLGGHRLFAGFAAPTVALQEPVEQLPLLPDVHFIPHPATTRLLLTGRAPFPWKSLKVGLHLDLDWSRSDPQKTERFIIILPFRRPASFSPSNGVHFLHPNFWSRLRVLNPPNWSKLDVSFFYSIADQSCKIGRTDARPSYLGPWCQEYSKIIETLRDGETISDRAHELREACTCCCCHSLRIDHNRSFTFNMYYIGS